MSLAVFASSTNDHANATHFVQEGSLLDEVTRRQQTQTPLTYQEVLHIFLQVKFVTFLFMVYHGGITPSPSVNVWLQLGYMAY